MSSTFSEDALRGQQSRIMNAMRKATMPDPVQQLGDISSALMSQYSGQGNYIDIMKQNQQAQQKAALGAEMGIYDQMKEQVARGDLEAKSVDDAINEVAGNDPKIYATILDDLHNDPEPVNTSNAKAKVMKYAAERGIVPMSVQKDRMSLQKIARESSGEDVGPTGNIIRTIAREKGIPFSEAAYLYQTGFRGSTQYDANGNIIPMAGAAAARGIIKEGEAAGTATGKDTAEAKVAAKLALPTIESGAEQSLQLIDALVKHPGLSYSVGKSSVLPIVPGTDAADFVSRLDQLKGKQFLEAFTSLKGGGSITEVEGAKAEAAIARMQRSQSEAAFKEAAKEFQGIIRKGVERARSRAGNVENIPIGGNLGTNTNAAPKRLKYNPATGEFE